MTLTVSEARNKLRNCGYADSKVDAFLGRFKASPDVWRKFESIALDLISRNKQAGAKLILERIRWETSVEGGEEWKVNNTDAPYYARIFATKYPEHAAYFEFRAVGGKVLCE